MRSNAYGDVANVRREHLLIFSLRYGQDEKFAKIQVAGQLLYCCTFYALYKSITIEQKTASIYYII